MRQNPTTTLTHLFNMMREPASHAKAYANFLPFAVEAYADWETDVCSGAYPEDKHSFHMEEYRELQKFLDAVEQVLNFSAFMYLFRTAEVFVNRVSGAPTRETER